MEYIISLSVTRVPAIDLRAILYEITTPNTQVAAQTVLAANAGNATLTFTNLQQIAHILRVYEYDGGVLGALIKEWTLQPKQTTVETPEDLELICGLNPGDLIAPGSDIFDGSALTAYSGKVVNEDYRVVQRGFGPIRSDEVEDVPPFGFRLLGGLTFNQDDTYFLQFIPKLLTAPASPVSGKQYRDIKTITASLTLDSTYLDCVVDINAASNKITATLDYLTNVPDNSVFEFIQQRGNQINAVVKAQTGEVIVHNGAEVNQIILRKREKAKLVKKGAKWYVVSGADSFGVIGKVFAGYKQGDDEVILQGQEVNRDEYPAVWAFVQTLSLGNGVANESDWIADTTTRRSMFSLGDGSTTFRFPDLRGVDIRFLDQGRGLDLIRIAASLDNVVGSYQADQVKSHDHDTPFRRDNNVVSFGTGNGVAVSLPAGSALTLKTGLTGGAENTTKNAALLPLMKI